MAAISAPQMASWYDLSACSMHLAHTSRLHWPAPPPSSARWPSPDGRPDDDDDDVTADLTTRSLNVMAEDVRVRCNVTRSTGRQGTGSGDCSGGRPSLTSSTGRLPKDTSSNCHNSPAHTYQMHTASFHCTLSVDEAHNLRASAPTLQNSKTPLA